MSGRGVEEPESPETNDPEVRDVLNIAFVVGIVGFAGLTGYHVALGAWVPVAVGVLVTLICLGILTAVRLAERGIVRPSASDRQVQSARGRRKT